MQILISNKYTEEKGKFKNFEDFKIVTGLCPNEVIDYLVNGNTNYNWTRSWVVDVIDDDLTVPESLDIHKDIMIIDYINRGYIIYDNLEAAVRLTNIPALQIVELLNIKDRANNAKYLAGYEFFYVAGLNLKPPKLLEISQEQAQQDHVLYLETRLKQGLDYDSVVIEEPDTKDNVVIYEDPEGRTRVEVYYQDETVWMTQKQIAELFDVGVPAIFKHLANIFETGELVEEVVISKMEITTQHGALGGKTQTKLVKCYNLDAIISVGYRVNSKKAVFFRQWASNVLKEYLIKGFALDDKRLKHGKNLYEKEMVERIREIRSSERQVLQKLKELLKLSTDYNQNSQETLKFFATVQNKLHYAAHGHTAAEIIHERSDASKHNAGMTNFIGLVPSKEDAKIAKSYLDEIEISVLNHLTTSYLDYAEFMAGRGKLLSMQDWLVKIDEFIAFCELNVLQGKGSISRKDAVKKAIREFEAYVQALIAEYDDIDNLALHEA